MRRQLILAVAALAVAIALPVRAQDALATEAQDAARTWLALIDKGETLSSYMTASDRFRAAVSADNWATALQSRAPLGTVQQRAVQSTRLMKSINGLPDGQYAIVVFRTAFTRREVAIETVTLELAGARWRVVGYHVA
ncbi:MAG: DUF4019 domain-containing protein [Proteobacteria bacterium]|nr:DUF4019 domain-containing protein [Pseudomonadota bacterium]